MDEAGIDTLTAALTESRRTILRLQRRLAEARETTYRRLAQDIHDQFGQHVAAMRVELEISAAAGLIQASAVERLVGNLEALAHDLRNVARDLHPPELEKRGLLAALRADLPRRLGAAGIRCVLELDEWVQSVFDGDDARNVYRIIQEAATNVIRHATASEVLVRLSAGADGAYLLVADDGVGFEPDTRDGPGFGLQSMHDRCAAVGGALEVTSVPGRGTTVRAIFDRANRSAGATR